jgi:hypothetical protein
MPRTHKAVLQDQAGFSLVEALIAIMLLTIGVLGLAHVFAVGLGHLAGSSARLVAREKAREAIETIHAARDSRVISWAQLQNENDPGDCPEAAGVATQGGGAFLNGFQALNQPGPNGVVNTALPEGMDPEPEKGPGPNGRLGDDDDADLLNFEREIHVCTVALGLRRVDVRIRYRAAGRWLTYSVTTLLSSRS